MAPLLTQKMAKGALEWERLQIEIDNAAIRLGQADRELFNFIESQNRRIQNLEKAHDVAHACVQKGGTAALACIKLDMGLEVAINGLYSYTASTAQRRWMSHGISAGARLAALGHGKLTRSPVLPFRPVRCPRCRLHVGLKPHSTRGLRSTIVGDPRRFIRVSIEFENNSKRWNYALRD